MQKGTLSNYAKWTLPPSRFWTGPFTVERMYGHFLYLPCFIEIHAFNLNNVDSDQTPRSVASDLGLNCLPMSLLIGRYRHERVNLISYKGTAKVQIKLRIRVI